MVGPVERINSLFWLISGSKIRRCLGGVETHMTRLRDLTDDELTEECLRVLAQPKLLPVDSPRAEFLRGFRAHKLNDRDAEALALAKEAFSRFPPGDLPRGSALHDGQMLAAVHLLSGSLVQMDTGEGKTFAIAVAAFALLRTHARVYIVTANPYLAARDVMNTVAFWNGMGVSVGRGLWGTEGGSESQDQWRAQVVYTTLSALEFRSLDEDLGDAGISRTLSWSAALLDEADAVLLEQADRAHINTRSTEPATKDWSLALQIADTLTDEHVMPDPVAEPSATLSPQGEVHAITAADAGELSLSDRLVLLHDIELAYAATHVAREGHNYSVRSGRIVRIDPESGWPTPGLTPNWVAPLAHRLGLPGAPRSVVRHEISGMTLLWRFDHLAGTSGTIMAEALDYLLLLGLPPARIPPRVPRYDGRLPDRQAANRDRVHRWVAEQVEEHAATRPILIATDSIQEADELADGLRAVMPAGCSVRAVSGETIAEERVFERAGMPGVTIVSTRVAGRGVDIQLSPEAREAGGTLLLALGHAAEGRIDRQLLGRVGRAGDPYSAVFINHPDDAFLRNLFANKQVKRVIESMTADEVVESGLLTRRIAKAQRAIRRRRLASFAGGVNMQSANRDAYEMLRDWRQNLGVDTGGDLAPGFVGFLVDRYLAARLPALQFDAEDTGLDPRPAASDLATLVGRPEEEERLVVQTSGQSSAEIRRVFSGFLAEALDAAMEKNRSALETLSEARRRGERAALDIRLLRFMRAVTSDDGPKAPADVLRHALKAHDGAAPVSASAEAREARLQLLDDWFGDAWEQEQDVPAPPESADREMAALVTSFSAIVVPEHASNGEERDELLERIDRAVAERAEDAGRLDPRWHAQESRTAWVVASETIDRATQRLVTGLDRTRFELSHTTSDKGFYRAYAHRVEDLRRDVQWTLANELCVNLLASADPTALDTLFAERDQELRVTTPHTRVELPALPTPTTSRPPPAPAVVTGDAITLIQEFLAALKGRMGDKAPEEKRLYPALNALMGSSPIATLTDPDRVAEAYAGWKRSPSREAVPLWGRRQIDRQVRAFLDFLYERGLAAPLPSGVTQRSGSLVRRIRSSFASRTLGLGMLVLAAAVGTAAILALIPNADVPAPSIGLGFLDRVTTGGALSAGSALGPGLLAIVGGAWCRWLLGDVLSGDAGTTPVERLGSIVLLAAGVLALVRPWHGGIGGQTILDLGWCIALFAGGLLLRTSVWTFETLVHVQLSAGLAAAFACFAAIPYLAQHATTADVLLLAVISGAVLLGSMPLRRARIGVLALRVDLRSPDRQDMLAVPLTIRGRLSISAHAAALLFAWIASSVLISGSPLGRAIVAGGGYVAVLGLWAWMLAKAATSPEHWRERMRKAQQGFDPGAGAGTLEAALSAARRRIFGLELATAVPLVALGGIVAAQTDADVVKHLPLGAAAITATVFTVELGRAFVRSLLLPIAGAGRTPSDALSDERESLGSLADALGRRINRWLGGGAIVLLALKGINDVLGIWSIVASVAKWLYHLFA